MAFNYGDATYQFLSTGMLPPINDFVNYGAAMFLL
jgi:hypothetical protein